jgi:hypothetical protein
LQQIDSTDDLTLADRLGTDVFRELRARILQGVSTAEPSEDHDAE